MIPDNVEKIIMTKEDYDRNVEQLLIDKIKAEQEVERLNNIIKEVREYIEDYNLEHLHEINEHNLADILEELLEILDKEKV